jgi:hypothetical protein
MRSIAGSAEECGTILEQLNALLCFFFFSFYEAFVRWK